jgi:hypothetical protein
MAMKVAPMFVRRSTIGIAPIFGSAVNVKDFKAPMFALRAALYRHDQTDYAAASPWFRCINRPLVIAISRDIVEQGGGTLN